MVEVMEEADLSLECIERSNTDAWAVSDYKNHTKQESPIRLGKACPTAVEYKDEITNLDCHANIPSTGQTTPGRETSRNGIKVHPPETFNKKMYMHLNSNDSTMKEKFDGIGDSNKVHNSEKKDKVTYRKMCEASKCKKGISFPCLLIFVCTIFAVCCLNYGATIRRIKRSNNVNWKASQPLEFGKTARLSCCTNDKNLLGKTWKFTGGPNNAVLALGNISSNISKYGIQRQKNGFALLIYNLTKNDTDHLYTCSFGYYNSLSKTLITNDDNTFAPPNVTISQSSYDVYIGSSVTLSSNVTSDLLFYDVYWMKKTGQDNESIEVIINSKYSGGDYNTSSLTILITDKNDTGAYTCIARNEYGKGTSSDITLTVIEPNVVGNTKVGLAVGVTFACVALPAIIVLVIWIYRSGKCPNLRRQNDKEKCESDASINIPMIGK